MAEATAQAMWGAAYHCTQPGGGGVAASHLAALGGMGLATWTNTAHPLGRVAHCIAATLASLAAHAPSAKELMAVDGEEGVIATLMLLCKARIIHFDSFMFICYLCQMTQCVTPDASFKTATLCCVTVKGCCKVHA